MIVLAMPANSGDQMQQVAFDRQRADTLVQEIGSEIVRGSKYAARPWQRIAVVAEVADRKRLFGYMYWDDDQWEAATPDGFRALTLFQELQSAMRVADKPAWKKCLVRIDRASGAIDIDFDYAGDKWVPDPADPAKTARSLI